MLLTLLFTLSGSAMGAYSDFWRSSNAASAGSRTLRQELYEIGQKTLTNNKFQYYSARNAHPVKRGIDIVRQEGWVRAVLASPSGIITQGCKTLGTGLTPAAAQNVGTAAAAGWGVGTGVYGVNQ